MSRESRMPVEVRLLKTHEHAPPRYRIPNSCLDDLAFHVRNLNYGEFAEFCGEVGADADKLWKWATERFR